MIGRYRKSGFAKHNLTLRGSPERARSFPTEPALSATKMRTIPAAPVGDAPRRSLMYSYARTARTRLRDEIVDPAP